MHLESVCFRLVCTADMLVFGGTAAVGTVKFEFDAITRVIEQLNLDENKMPINKIVND